MSRRKRIWRSLGVGVTIVWRALVHFIDDYGTTQAGSIAFTSLFALFPFLIFLTTLAGEFGQEEAARRFVDLWLEGLPPEVVSTIRPAIDQVVNVRRTGLMTISILVTIWTASSGLEALRTAVNHAYGIQDARPFWWLRLQSIFFTIIMSVAILVLMIVVVAGPLIWNFLVDLLKVPPSWGWLYTSVRYLLAVLLLHVVIALLYQWLPNRHLRSYEILPGAVVTVVAWLVTASLFSLYLQNLGRFSVTYGSLGGIVVTLMFFYLSAAIFIFGAEVNGAWRRDVAERLRAERAAGARRRRAQAPAGDAGGSPSG
ncbi:MAG TPA: YihY/virulence factor BrkB family protein [Geminicoccaceae bacterium]|nr:YihY/virulence factor BrkB family protein [Geminicoccaceae bacterium]